MQFFLVKQNTATVSLHVKLSHKLKDVWMFKVYHFYLVLLLRELRQYCWPRAQPQPCGEAVSCSAPPNVGVGGCLRFEVSQFNRFPDLTQDFSHSNVPQLSQHLHCRRNLCKCPPRRDWHEGCRTCTMWAEAWRPLIRCWNLVYWPASWLPFT